MSETRGKFSRVTVIVRRAQLKDMMQPIEAIGGLDAVSLILCVWLLPSPLMPCQPRPKKLCLADPLHMGFVGCHSQHSGNFVALSLATHEGVGAVLLAVIISHKPEFVVAYIRAPICLAAM
jgi:hypothetical protein